MRSNKKIYKFFRKRVLALIPKKKCWHFIFRAFPVRKTTIFFESHRGLSYSDNPKAICEAILASNIPVKCVWSLQDTTLILPKSVIKVKHLSISYYYYHACSRMLIHNGEFPQNLPIRKNQTYINTQHGTPLKLMGIDIPRNRSKVDPKSYSKDGRWNYLLSPNPYTTQIFRRAYIYSGPILEVGYPRNDIFYQKNTPSHIKFIKQNLGLPLGKKIILYAPTWRESAGKNRDYDFKLKLDIQKLSDHFSNEFIIILRLHHLIVKANKIDQNFSSFVFDYSSAQYDIQELMLVSDILITDYSSVMFDYSNLSRPIIFYTYDLKEYLSNIRGTYFDLAATAPGPLVENMEDLIKTIHNIGIIDPIFSEKQKAFRHKFCSLEKGNATQKVIDRIIKPDLGLI
jgi:CDP-glycerol glycerophosphotransferase